MSTKDNLNVVRYFTGLDTYHYSVDNRPLVDLRQNVERVCTSVDSTIASANMLSLADGFITRAIATPNTAIGVITYSGSMDITIQRAVFTQELAASTSDTRIIPTIGVRQEPETFSFTAPLTVGQLTPWIIQARVVDATIATPLYDSSLADMAASTRTGQVEWQLVQGTSQVISAAPTYPSPTAGWVEVLRVLTYYNTAQITPSLIQMTGFKLEGEFGGGASSTPEYNISKFSHVMTSASDTVTGITVNCDYGIVFVDGLYQPDVTIIDSTSIQFPEVLSIGQVVDVLTTAGGSASVVDSSSFRFVFTATSSSQTLFSDANMEFSEDSALVFINGQILDPSKYSFSVDGHTLILSTGVSIGTLVYVFELRAVGVGRPAIPSGSAGDVLVKTGPGASDYAWGAGSVGVSGGVEGQVLVKTGAGPQDATWANNVAHGSVRLDYVPGGNTVKLMPEGGGGVTINGVLRVIPTSGVTCSEFTNPSWLSSAVANGFQNALVWFCVSYTNSVFEVTPFLASTHTFTYDALGVPILAEYPDRTIVGAARLISGPNRVLPFKSGTQCLVRSMFGSDVKSSIRTIDSAPNVSQTWAAIGPTIVVEPSGVAWKQAPLSVLDSVVVGANTLYFQVAGLVLPGETYEASICGAYDGIGQPSVNTSVRLNTSGIKYDSSLVYGPRSVFPSQSNGGLHISVSGRAPVNSLKEVLVLPEADVRNLCTFRTGYYQTVFNVR